MGASNTKEYCNQYAAGLEEICRAHDADHRHESFPWYSDVKVDKRGCRIFPRLPPPGQHPRLLFTKEEIPHMIAQHTHTHIKDFLGARRNQRTGKLRQYYAQFAELSDEERINPSREILDKYFTKDEERNQNWLLAYLNGFIIDDADLMNMVKELVLFYSTIIIKSAELAMKEDIREGNYAMWTSKSTFWDVTSSWLFGGICFSVMYDLLHTDLSEKERSLMRTAISTAITGRQAWGMGWSPRRIQSNWAPYHGGLLAMAYAIEGEEGEDKEVVSQFSELMNTFLDFSVYESGHPIEDSYFVNLALREGSVAFMLMSRRGFNLFAKENYANVIRKWMPYALDPHADGEMYGGSSGSVCIYPAGIIVAKFVYPKDRVVDFVYRHYLRQQGKEYFRLLKMQTDYIAALFAIPALNETLTSTCTGDDVHSATECDLSKTFTCFNRGKVIMRSDWTPKAISFTLDARPDPFLIGHDSPQRGTFVMYAHGRLWAACPEWILHKQSANYSLITIDGKGYLPKAPWAKLLSSVEGAKDSSYAAADLTYPANYEWTQWAKPESKRLLEVEGWEPEPNDPRDFGMNTWWLPNKVFDEPTIGFAGLYQWRRRFNNVAQITRSALMVRDVDAPFVIISDDAIKGDKDEHEYVWNMTMPSDAKLISFEGTDAVVSEEGSGDRQLIVRLLDESMLRNVICNIHKSTVVNPKNANDKHVFKRLQFKLTAKDAHFKIGLFPLASVDSPLPTTVWAKESVGDTTRTLAVNGQVLIEFKNLADGSNETVMTVVK